MKSINLKKLFTLFALLFAEIIHASAPAQNDSGTHGAEVLHLIGDDFDFRITLPNPTESTQRLHPLSKMFLSASFPAYQVGTEAVIDDVNTNSFSVINMSTGERQLLYRFSGVYLTGTTGGIDENGVYVSTYRRKFDDRFQIWKISRKNNNARMVVEAKSMFFSARCGKLVYVGDNSQIKVRRHNGNEEFVAAHGDFPVILPNCGGFIFGSSSHGLHELTFHSGLDAKNIANRAIIRSIIKEFDPLVRVSRDSQYIAFRYKSDMSREPVHVVRISDGKEIYVSKPLPIKNWHFSD